MAAKAATSSVRMAIVWFLAVYMVDDVWFEEDCAVVGFPGLLVDHVGWGVHQDQMWSEGVGDR